MKEHSALVTTSKWPTTAEVARVLPKVLVRTCLKGWSLWKWFQIQPEPPIPSPPTLFLQSPMNKPIQDPKKDDKSHRSSLFMWSRIEKKRAVVFYKQCEACFNYSVPSFVFWGGRCESFEASRLSSRECRFPKFDKTPSSRRVFLPIASSIESTLYVLAQCSLFRFIDMLN